jgi:hypothetical protein
VVLDLTHARADRIGVVGRRRPDGDVWALERLAAAARNAGNGRYTRMMRGVMVFLAAVVLMSVAPTANAARPLKTGFADPAVFDSPRAAEGFGRVQAAGGSVVRLVLTWATVAPGHKPATFNPSDPREPAYNWAGYDRLVEAATARGLEVIFAIQHAPPWAEGAGTGNPGTVRPDPVAFGRFARAAAERYSGRFDVNRDDPYAERRLLPRVRYWQAWNEPNRDYFLMPQYQRGRIVSAAHYRAMVNNFADAVRAVDPRNVVVAGGLAPIGRRGKPGPMPFMRAFLAAPVKFDVWSHHPYTSGGPTHRASSANDVSLGDLPEMRSLLRSSVRSGRVRSNGSVGFWVTEFSWDSSPPDPDGVPSVLHARWVSEALYRMWQNGISVVTWFRLNDDPLRTSHYQSGLWTVSWKPKRALTAFRFPVVALPQSRGILVWGRTPTSSAGRVVLEISVRGRWRPLGSLTANSAGIFTRTYRTPIRKGHVRARFARQTSLPFSLTPVRDRYVNPFGCGGVIPC